jgi:hypothetical protein
MGYKLFTFWLAGFLKGVGGRALAENEVKLIRGELEKTMNPVVYYGFLPQISETNRVDLIKPITVC